MLLRRHKQTLAYAVVLLLVVYFATSLSKLSNENSTLSLLDLKLTGNKEENNSTSSDVTEDIQRESDEKTDPQKEGDKEENPITTPNDNNNNNNNDNSDGNADNKENTEGESNDSENNDSDQYSEESAIDTFLKEVVKSDDEQYGSSALKEDISKMTDEEIRERMRMIKEKQAEKELEKLKQQQKTKQSLTDKNDNVEGTKIQNDEKIRKDESPDGLPWAQYEIERRIPPNYKDYESSRANATLFTLCRNSELYEILDSIHQLEERFNKNHHYDWVFLNDEPFSEEFIELTSNVISGRARYGLIPRKHWSYPDYIDENKAREIRESRKWSTIAYGTSESYRHMCRFNSLFFYKHPIMEEYQYYWRVEPHVRFDCDVLEDPFKFLEENNKKYGFTISMKEIPNTIETLWKTSKLYFKSLGKNYFKQGENDNLAKFISDDNGENYNLCHFWTNFEIANLDIYRNEIYEGYVQHLDQAGGFFYERWGDAPIHSIIFSLMLNKDEIHLFQNIAYEHTVANQCPLNDEFRKKARCVCNPINDWNIRSASSCNSKFLQVGNYEKNVDYDKYVKLLHEKQEEDEKLKNEQRKLRLEAARRQSVERRRKSEERRKARLKNQQSRKQKIKAKAEAEANPS